MFITINGHLGSGKSTICCLLAEQFDFKVFNTGIFQRQTANELNISTLELNEKSKEDFSLDYKIDRAVVEYANAHNGERRLSQMLCKPPIWCRIEAPYWRF